MFGLTKKITCFRCAVSKPSTDYRVDIRRKSGFEGTCRECRSVKRVNAEQPKKDGKKIEMALEAPKMPPVKRERVKVEKVRQEKKELVKVERIVKEKISVPIIQESRFQQILEKHGARHGVLSFGDNRAVLQIHSTPSKIWKGLDPNILLEEALA